MNTEGIVHGDIYVNKAKRTELLDKKFELEFEKPRFH